VSGGGQFFNALVGAVRGFLPPFMRNMITLIPDENCLDGKLDEGILHQLEDAYGSEEEDD
jgi:hypothetical protein